MPVPLRPRTDTLPVLSARQLPGAWTYVAEFQAKGGSHVMLAKGNRSKQVTDACKEHGGFYLGSIGGPAARLAQDCIKKVECVEYPELGMEAIWRIEVEDFPPSSLSTTKVTTSSQISDLRRCRCCRTLSNPD